MINFCINGIDKIFEVEDFNILRMAAIEIELKFNEKIALGGTTSMTEIIHNFCQKIGLPELEFESDDIIDDMFEFECFSTIQSDIPAILITIHKGRRDFK